MPTLTLNIPDALHARLKAAAARSRRSLNGEILARLERDIEPDAFRADEYVARLSAFTARLPRVSHAMMAKHKRRGRP